MKPYNILKNFETLEEGFNYEQQFKFECKYCHIQFHEKMKNVKIKKYSCPGCGNYEGCEEIFKEGRKKVCYDGINTNDLYEIDKAGNVYSHVGKFKLVTPHEKNGKAHVTFNGDIRRYSIHRLLMHTFKGITESEVLLVRHLNDIPTDNRLENLEWGTYTENGADRSKNHALFLKTVYSLFKRGISIEELSVVCKKEVSYIEHIVYKKSLLDMSPAVIEELVSYDHLIP